MELKTKRREAEKKTGKSYFIYVSNTYVIAFQPDQIQKLKEQDPNAFNEFYLQTVDMFFRYINANYFLPKEDAEDVIADFYVKFREAIKKFDEKLSFTGYFRTIFKNTLKDFFKKNTDIAFTELKTSEEDENFEDTLVDDFDISILMENDFSFERIQQVMKQLDATSRDIIYFKFIEEKTNEEIVSITGIANDTIRQRISRAIKYLKQLLEE